MITSPSSDVTKEDVLILQITDDNYVKSTLLMFTPHGPSPQMFTSPSSDGTTKCQYQINLSFLLIIAGDIEENPGPTDLNKCPCKENTREQNHKCSECKQAWHVTCIGLNGITEGALSKLKSWKCVLCNTLPVDIQSKFEERIKENILPIKELIEKVEQNILEKIEEIKETRTNDAEGITYKDILVKDLEKKVNETNRLMRNQLRQNDDNKNEQENDKLKRIVLKPKDIAIRNSRDLRKKFNQYYPDVFLKHARISAGGSYVFEFEEEEAANQLEQDWSENHFAGNSGLVKLNDRNRTGLVKFVYDDIQEEQIENDIKTNYPEVKYELFKKEEQFTGMIKVIFMSEADLKQAIANKFTISHRKYYVEEFKRKPRVIKCNVCQRLGHVSRLCRSKDNPRCGKCSQEGHETKDCNAEPADHKCFHCSKTDHITGSYSCHIIKEKLKELQDRQDYG